MASRSRRSHELSTGLIILLYSGNIFIIRICLHLPLFILAGCTCEIFSIVLEILLELFRLVFKKPSGVMAPVFVVGPFFIDVFVGHELSDLVVACVRSWLFKSLWKILLPVRIYKLIAKVLDHLHLFRRPFV